MISSKQEVLATFGQEYFIIPKTCKAGVVLNEGPDFTVGIDNVAVPEPAASEILVRINVSGVCRSDLSFMGGDYGRKMSDFGNRCAGHEGAGVVVKLGSNVTNWEIGDRVGIKGIRDVCGVCENCWRGRDNHCVKSTAHGFTHQGSFQQYITTSARYATRIPDGVSDDLAAPLMCAGITAYRSLMESNYKQGNWVVFPGGGGGVGIMAVQIAKVLGLRPIVIDAGTDKESAALENGAEIFLDFEKVADIPSQVVSICGGIGAHGVVVTAAQAYSNAVSYVGRRTGAKIMCIGMPKTEMFVGGEIHKIVLQNMSFVGTLVGSYSDADEVLDIAKRGLIKAVGEVRPFSKLPESVNDLRDGKVSGRIVIDFNSS